jgi:hypothetical protein
MWFKHFLNAHDKFASSLRKDGMTLKLDHTGMGANQEPKWVSMEILKFL